MSKKEDLRKIYAKASTPEELFLDTISELDKVKETVTQVEDKVANAIEYVYENKPKSDDELKEIIQKLIPAVKDGKTPTTEELLEIIQPLIPIVHDGKNGNEITPEEIRDKLASLKDDQRLSVLALKDLEWLREKINWIQGNIVGGITTVTHDNTLTGDGTPNSPLHAVNDTTAVWGGITGTLSNQTDLQNALNVKCDESLAIAYAIAL